MIKLYLSCIIMLVFTANSFCAHRVIFNKRAASLCPKGNRPCGPVVPIQCYTSLKLPLCLKIAELSYETLEEGKGKLLPKFLAEEINKRNINFKPISYFVGEFSGPVADIRWLKDNYPILLCSFNPKLVPNDETVFRSTISHVREWMDLVENGNYHLLMEPSYLYCPNCCSGK